MHRIMKLYCVVFMIVFQLFLTGCGKKEEVDFQEISLEELDEKGTSGDEEISEDSGEEEMKSKPEETDEGIIYVHICGEVSYPGVYELDAGSRIYEALEAAGGVTEKAADHSVNQAEVLSDGQQLYIPSEEEIQHQNEETVNVDSGKVDINKASKEELMTLTGIGEAKADAIIRYREESGSFRSIEEVMEIEGIKEGVFRKIEDQITVS